jgi:Tol biopolymer transport system component
MSVVGRVSRSCYLSIWLAIFLLGGTTLFGQYFGQNKIVYQAFGFKVLKTEHFDIYYYPAEAVAVNDAARMAERWYARHHAILGYDLEGRQPLILYASGPQFDETNVISGQLGEGTGGVTEAQKRRIVLPFAGPLAETDHVIGHELVHAFQYSLTGERGGRAMPGGAAIEKLPLWFIEGMAEFLSLGPEDPNTAMWMRDATRSKKKLPSVAQLDNGEYFPYRWGQALLAFIAGRWGDEKIPELLRSAGRSGDIEVAIKNVLAIDTKELTKQWHQSLHDTYDPFVKATKSPGDYGKQLISQKLGGGELNVGPVLSPDGKKLIFFSEKNQFAIDLFLADAETGKIKRNIVHTELDPHFSSLEFIYSAGAWDPDGKQIVFSAVVNDRPSLTILDVNRDKVVREIVCKNLDEIYNPSWSPDGRYIAFSALAGGYSDLFLYDLQQDSLRRVTDDAYADLHPAWSPDGSKIAFVTDRFTTNLAELKAGNYQIALLDPQTGQMTPLNIFAKGKEINPQWSPDGSSIYFLSDQDGITNIYRFVVAEGKAYQVTNLYSGVSGITAISQGMSVASKANRLVYSAYEDGKYNIYAIDSLDVLTGVPPTQIAEQFAKDSVTANPAMLPPPDQNGDQLLKLLDSASFGLPPIQQYAVKDYDPHLSIDMVGQPYLAAGADALGVQLGGGVALFWSDMLNDRSLVTALQLQTDGGFTDVGALVGYQNIRRRWQWGVAAQQVPYTLSQVATGVGNLGATPVIVNQQYTFRQINRELTGILAYPFDRAKRLEFSAGYTHVSFTQQVRTQAFDANVDTLISDQTITLPSLGSIGLATTQAAFVYDNALYGATSPILGQRFRLEAQPAFGSISFYTLLADYRKYFMPVRPFTLAFRFLHYGRYGGGSEDERLTPLFIGYQDLIRGYDAGSFDASECNGDTNCITFNRLFGSRMAVANLELRFPLLGLLKVGHGFYGFLPLETGLFYDEGVAWDNADNIWFASGGSRKPVRSYGGLARLNLAGYLVLEVDYVKPVDRPQKGAYWQFNISPGF